MKIYFVRHGETDFNKQRKFYGTTDVVINQTGQAQCLQVKEKLADKHIKIVYTSSRKRTKESAEIIFPNHQPIAEAFLDEWGFGLWEGLNADEIQAVFPIEWQNWLNDPFGYTPPAADPYAQFVNEMIAGFQTLLTATEDIAIVTHLGTIRVLLHDIYPDVDFWDIHLTQGNYTCLSYVEKDFNIEVWNK